MTEPSQGLCADDVIITDELDRRPSRAPDHQAQIQALSGLAETMAVKPDDVLQRLVEAALRLTRADSAGVSLLEPGGAHGVFRWVATAGAWAHYRGDKMPREESPCGEVIARDQLLLLRQPDRAFPALLQDDPPIAEGLLTPFEIDGAPTGTVWVIKHDPEGRFDAEDARLLQSLARFASAAVHAVQARKAAEAQRDLEAADRARAEAELRENEQRLAAELSGTRLLQRLSTRLIPEQAPEALYEQILDTALELMRADAVSIQLLDEDGKRLRRVATRNLHPDSTEYWTWVDATHASTCGQALAKNERVMVEDVEASPELAGTGDLKAFRASGIRAVQSSPLLTRTGQPIGMISTHWRAPRRFEESDFDLFDILARQVADLFERSRTEAALRESEERQAYVLRLSDALRPLTDTIEIIGTATRLLGEGLGASRAYYAEWPPGTDYLEIRSDYAAPGLPSLAGRYPIEFFRSTDERFREGRTWVIQDAADGTIPAAERDYCLAHGVAAWVDVPLVKGGKLQAALFLVQDAPRCWNATEIALVEETAERTWAAVERARAEAALHDSEEKYRSLFQTMGQGYCHFELIRDADGRAVDQLYLRFNPAFERLFGMPAAEAEGRKASEVFGNYEPMWVDAFERVVRTRQPERIEQEFAALNRWFEASVYPDVGDRLVVLFEEITERKHVEQRLRESEERYRELFERIDEGFCIVEMIFDDGDKPVDYRFIAVNPAFEGQTGIVDAEGRRMRDIAPDHEQHWFDHYGAIALTGRPERFEAPAKALGDRWYDLHAFRVGDPAQQRVAILFNDITQRQRDAAALRESEERQAFLLKLSDAIRPIADAAAIQAATTRLVGEHLGADRVMYGEVEGERGAETGIIRGQYVRPSREGEPAVAPFPERFTFEPFGLDAMAWRYGGEGLNVADIEVHPNFDAAEREAWAAAQVRAAVVIPLVEGGRLVAEFGVHSTAPRAWADAELSLIRDVAERSWAAAERARAEAALHESKERHAYLLELSDALRPLTDPAEIQQEAMRVLGERLGVNRAQYYVADETGEYLSSTGGYTDGVPPAVGRFRLIEFGRYAYDGFHAGETQVVADAATDPRISETVLASYRQVGFLAYIGVPFVRHGRLLGTIAVHQSVPRPWTDNERLIVEETAERAGIAVEQARAERALRASEERFRQFGEASQDVLWIRDAESFQWEYLTPAFETIYGLDRDAALSGDNMARWVELIVPEDRDRAVACLERVRDGEWVTFEYRIRRPVDGELRWLRNTDFPIRDGSGRVAHIGGIGHDVTALKHAEMALATAALRQRTLVEGIPNLIWRAVDGGEWTWASPQWTDCTGQSDPDSRGWGWLEMVHVDDQAAAREAWDRAMASGGFEVEYRLCHVGEGRYRWFKTRATPVRDNDGKIVEWLGTSTDINDLRELQARQGVLVAELQHRTRNLITVVRAVSQQTLRETASLDDFGERFGDRLSALSRVQGLLSHLSAGQRVSFEELLGSELTALGVPSDKVTLEGPADVPLRSATVQTFSLALHELATNALKYGALSAPGGHLTVRWQATVAGDGEPRLQVDWRETGVDMTHVGERPQGGGYGRELIERALPYQLQAETSYELTPDGVHCTIDVPVSATTA